MIEARGNVFRNFISRKWTVHTVYQNIEKKIQNLMVIEMAAVSSVLVNATTIDNRKTILKNKPFSVCGINFG